MTIKIAYRSETTPDGSVVHIAEAVTQDGRRFSSTSTRPEVDDIVHAHAKRRVLYDVIDDAIHVGVL